MNKKLTEDVSIQELQEYRREGFTNSQIAELLNVNTRTIRNYLGPDNSRPKKILIRIKCKRCSIRE